MSVRPPNNVQPSPASVVARFEDVSLVYGRTRALDTVSLEVPAGCMVGVIGPDGVGKSSLLSLVAGARALQQGRLAVLGGDMADPRHRRRACPRIAYMPQGLGRNLYPTLSVFENLDFFGRLFGQCREEREIRITELLDSTGLAPFTDRPVGKLSGGMKQKLGLCCALIHDPDLLVLDEPTTGVDPLSRRQFWNLVEGIRSRHSDMSVIVATAYMEEAARFDWLVAMDAGRPLAIGSPRELLLQTGSSSLDAAFIELLPEAKRRDYSPVVTPPRAAETRSDIAIEAEGLTMRFDGFVAVDHVSFRIGRGEIFGFLGSNGCGKTTTMKMLTGLLPASEGTATLFGHAVNPCDMKTRRRVGYMSQAFSLYSELTVRQNLSLHARLFQIPLQAIAGRVEEMAKRFDLTSSMDALPGALPLGVRQRLSLAVAMIHAPEMLILDEPTSGVDPVARDALWQTLVDLSRCDNVTIFISTHFMNEAERCDRISLMHAGKVLVSDTPTNIVRQRRSATLEDAFVSYLEEAIGEPAANKDEGRLAPVVTVATLPGKETQGFFSLRRMFSYTQREALELQRDPLRATLAVIGSLLLLLVIGYGINLDVEDLPFAVLDHDQTTVSRNYILDIAGSRYFSERPPILNYQDLDQRMRSGELGLAIEIPPEFARNLARGRNVEIAAWVDGSMPQRGETIRSYVQGMHAHWLAGVDRVASTSQAPAAFQIETRFRYNPDLRSLIAMVPAVIALLLLLIPAMLAAVSVVREKELGSIVNLYVTPVTRAEFLLGKQIPYVALAMLNFLLLTAFGVFVLHVPFSGSFGTFTLAALLYVTVATGIGLFLSTFISSQIAAIFGTAVLTILPTIQYSGMINPVSALQGAGALIGRLFPTTYFLTISRGTFSKALDFSDLTTALAPLALAVPLLLGFSVVLLKKQAR